MAFFSFSFSFSYVNRRWVLVALQHGRPLMSKCPETVDAFQWVFFLLYPSIETTMSYQPFYPSLSLSLGPSSCKGQGRA